MGEGGICVTVYFHSQHEEEEEEKEPVKPPVQDPPSQAAETAAAEDDAGIDTSPGSHDPSPGNHSWHGNQSSLQGYGLPAEPNSRLPYMVRYPSWNLVWTVNGLLAECNGT